MDSRYKGMKKCLQEFIPGNSEIHKSDVGKLSVPVHGIQVGLSPVNCYIMAAGFGNTGIKLHAMGFDAPLYAWKPAGSYNSYFHPCLINSVNYIIFRVVCQAGLKDQGSS